METILAVLLGIVILIALYYKGNAKIKTHVRAIENILSDDSISLKDRIIDSKRSCRQTKGLVSFAMYCVLDVIDNQL